LEEAQSCYQRFKDAQAQNESERALAAAGDVLAAIGTVKSDPTAILVPNFGEHVSKIGEDVTWLEETEKEVRDYLERNG
jgi:hypothetical protein